MKKRFFKVFKVLTITSTLLLTIFILTIAIITTNMNYQLPEIINVELYDSNNHKYLVIQMEKNNPMFNLMIFLPI